MCDPNSERVLDFWELKIGTAHFIQRMADKLLDLRNGN